MQRTMYVTKRGEPFYRTRMLRAGDPVTLTDPIARAYEAVGYVTKDAPAKKVEMPVVEPVKPAPKPRRTRKKATK